MKQTPTEAQKRVQERRRRRLEEDLRAVMATPAGRRTLWWVLDGLAKVSGPTFTGDERTYHAEGRRSVGLDLQAQLHAVTPDEYVLALQEELATRRQEAVEMQKARDSAEENDDGD